MSQFSRGARLMATKQSFKIPHPNPGITLYFSSVPILECVVDSFMILWKSLPSCLDSKLWICLLSLRGWWQEIVLVRAAFTSLEIPGMCVNLIVNYRWENSIKCLWVLPFVLYGRTCELPANGFSISMSSRSRYFLCYMYFKVDKKSMHMTKTSIDSSFYRIEYTAKANVGVLEALSNNVQGCCRIVLGLRMQCRLPTWLMGVT